MKKTILISLIMGMTLIFGSWAMAASAPTLPAPTNLICGFDADSANFSWDAVLGANKYSLDVEVLISGTWVEGVIVELSFGTSDRTDGRLMGDPNLDVPLVDFVYDLDSDPLTPPDVLSGLPARAKVKALNPPGKSQNNPFSDWLYFSIP
jgi:hypothetical protein